MTAVCRLAALGLFVLGVTTISTGAALAQKEALATFFRLARSSAALQTRAAELASSRDTRPEAKQFAARMLEFRRAHGPKLERAAKDANAALPGVQEFEHQVLIENLEPLDYLALSRRYAEVQIQALEQELQLYGRVASAPALRELLAETTPFLEQMLTDARTMRAAVGP